MAGDHYLQAALMGQWGKPCNKALRYWPICARMKESATAFDEPTTPDAVAKQNNLYPTWLEKIWQSYEGGLPRVIADLERGEITSEDAAFLLLHVAALKPRSATFLNDLNEHERQHGLPLTDGATLSVQRVLSMLATVPYAETWRWRVLRPPASEYFIMNDRGLCEFSDVDPRTGLEWPGRGVFFPLGPAIGILGFRYEEELHKNTYVFKSLDFSQRYTLNRGYTALLNLALWKDADRLVIGRCEDKASIESIDDGHEISRDLSGPYRFHRFGFFGD
jgi:hypothetical protein